MAEEAVLQAVIKLRDDITPALKHIASQSQTATRQMAAHFQGVGGAISGLRAAIGAIGAAIGFEIGKNLVEKFADSERAGIVLDVVLKGMGRDVAMLTPQINALAEATSQSGVSTREATIEAARYLATNKHISDELLPKAIALAVKLSAAFGHDVRAASMAVSQAIEGEAGMLRRGGFAMDDFSLKHMKASEIVAALTGVVKDLDTRISSSTAGQIQSLTNYLNDLNIAAGKLVAEGLTNIKQGLERVSRSAKEHGIADVTSSLLDGIAASVGLGDAFTSLQRTASEAIVGIPVTFQDMRVAEHLAAAGVDTVNESLGKTSGLFEKIRTSAKQTAGEITILGSLVDVKTGAVRPNPEAPKPPPSAEISAAQREVFKKQIDEINARFETLHQTGVKTAAEIAAGFGLAGVELADFTTRTRELEAADRSSTIAIDSMVAGLKAFKHESGMTGAESANLTKSWESYWAGIGSLAQIQVKLMQDIISRFADTVANMVVAVLDKAAKGEIHTMRDVMKTAGAILREFVEEVLREMIRIAVQKAVMEVVALVAGGGVFEGGLKFAGGMQGGGVVDRAQFAVVGEGHNPEAVVPMPNGKIPVDLRGAVQQGGANVSITVNAIDAQSFSSWLGRPESREMIGNVVNRRSRETERSRI